MEEPSRGQARMGVLVPFTNTNLEPDLALLKPHGLCVYISRMGGYDAEEVPDEEQMAGLGAADLNEPLRLLEGVRPNVILYGCTSATLAHGPAFDRDLATRIKDRSGASTVTAAQALTHALHTLGVNRIAFASPYVSSLNDRAIAYLQDEGFDTVSRADVSERLGNDGQGALTPDDVISLALRSDCDEAQAVVLSCTDMRAVEVIDELETRLDKPVITSNQAMMFRALQLLNMSPVSPGFGKLMERV